MPVSGSYHYPTNDGNVSQPSKGAGVYDGITNLELDKAGYIVAMENAHHAVHEGRLYTATEYDSDLDTGEEKQFLIQTPAGTDYMHVVFEVNSTAQVKLELYESGSYPLSSSAVPTINHNRVNEVADSVLVWASCSIDGTSSGTLLDEHLIGGGQGVGKVGGALRTEEWIFSAGADYLLKVFATNDNTIVNTSIVYYISNIAS